ncbi:hypothetical protein VOLCADRAFT_99062 [Volvox carteri f. nagariensis]|uniref:Uncharacterized protein n=1 Tax=Volvox carteri f. nagariensis TaxID=3068 RepID=D8UGY4_VOLCA|nr:uncharacterized protein VOLCADRAFT_99062 [Volvox carteri f. nagariensis]EFJ41061.1 hypothetical protein VOLCADRAFT_99062 [Volvox carteri f. nagariensis]|eukprot:XP_002957925.1 hypothetical protein VOLCADRAFT_99062 [Volvox carteri f. nagariensis]
MSPSPAPLNLEFGLSYGSRLDAFPCPVLLKSPWCVGEDLGKKPKLDSEARRAFARTCGNDDHRSVRSLQRGSDRGRSPSTGFPCPAILQTGKPCPGYVCKMHVFFPSNQKKKQARLEAAIAAAAASKQRPVPVKAKAGAQAAIAAMKFATSAGVPQAVCQKPSRAAVKGPANVSANTQTLTPSANQKQRAIPGLDVEAFEGALPRKSRRAKAQLKAAVGGVRQSIDSHAAGAWQDSNEDNSLGGGDSRQRETVWDAFAKAPDWSSSLNYFDLLNQRNNSEHEGHFSAALAKRIVGGTAKGSSMRYGAAHERERSVATPNERNFQLALSRDNNSDGDSVTPALDSCWDLELLDSPASDLEAMKIGNGGILSDTTSSEILADQTDDPPVEFDIVYSAEDGSYLVLDALSNLYFRLEDVYSTSPELTECTGEDGNLYTCVLVRRSHLELRAQRQQAWLEAQDLQEQLQQDMMLASTPPGEELTMGSHSLHSAEPSPSPTTERAVDVITSGASAHESCEDDTDVASLMQLLAKLSIPRVQAYQNPNGA